MFFYRLNLPPIEPCIIGLRNEIEQALSSNNSRLLLAEQRGSESVNQLNQCKREIAQLQVKVQELELQRMQMIDERLSESWKSIDSNIPLFERYMKRCMPIHVITPVSAKKISVKINHQYIVAYSSSEFIEMVGTSKPAAVARRIEQFGTKRQVGCKC